MKSRSGSDNNPIGSQQMIATMRLALTLLLCITILLPFTETPARPHSSAKIGDSKPGSRQDLTRLEVLANLGDIDSQYQLGRHYLMGKGVSKDPKRASYWFGIAARKGHTLSQRILATLYFSGIGVRKAPAHALRWFREAAENGDPVAQIALADMYYRGIGTRRPDLKKAWQWMMAAAKNGDPMAQYRIGLMFRDGRGTRVNLSRAFLWLHVAALNTADEALKQEILAQRDEVGKRMSKRLLSATKQQSEQFSRRYANNPSTAQEG